jgi:hypothetical protein
MKREIKIIKRAERDKRIRPEVTRKLLLDEKSRLANRIKQIDQTLQRGLEA